jgi:hypothetical protein
MLCASKKDLCQELRVLESPLREYRKHRVEARLVSIAQKG